MGLSVWLVIVENLWYNDADDSHIPEVRLCTASPFAKMTRAQQNKIKQPPTVCWTEKDVPRGGTTT